MKPVSIPSTEQLRRLVAKPAFRVQAAVAVAAASGLIAFFAIDSGGGAPEQPAGTGARAVSPAQLSEIVTTGGKPIYWIGPRDGVTYELTQTATGLTYVRYLPAGAPAGDASRFLTIGTYPVGDAFAVTRRAARRKGNVPIPIGAGAVAFYASANPKSVYAAYRGGDYQIEVFDPSPAEARELVTAGKIRPVAAAPGVPTLPPGTPVAVSVAQLKALSGSLGQPIYWVGPQAGATYELTQKGSELFLRYLPQGVAVGDAALYLTVGTYTVANAVGVTQSESAQAGTKPVDVGLTGVSFYRVSRPQSVYLAFRGQNFQIEVYDPDPAEALSLASTGRVHPVG